MAQVAPVPVLKLGLLIALSILLAAPLKAQYKYPFLNSDLDREARVTNILSLMTLDEKISALGTTTAVPRLGIPDAGRFGAFHTSEVPYVLNTSYMSDRPFTDADRKIAAMMSSYWANFAANGDPNGKGLAQWAPVGEKQEIMELGDQTGPIPVASSPAKFAFFEKLLTAPGPSARVSS